MKKSGELGWAVCRAFDCQNVFEVVNSHHVFCSKKCAKHHSNLRNRKPRESRKCVGCGKSFTPDHGSQKYCKKKCRDSINNRKFRNKNPDYMSRKTEEWRRLNPDYFKKVHAARKRRGQTR